MLATSVVIPPAAVLHRTLGEHRARRGAPLDAVLLDRDGTLVVDVPYNGDPALVEPVPGAAGALGRLRAAGVRTAVVTNQSGVARGLIAHAQVAAVHARIDTILGPFGGWWYCPHDDDDRCGCRKPAPGLVRDAAAGLGCPVDRCIVIGDTGADVDAARHAGARAVLVPNARTRPDETAHAPVVAADLDAAVDYVLDLGVRP
jgi:histidinol-phosphate phosphatase family protein